MNDSFSNWIDWLDLNETDQLEEVSHKANINLNDHLITPSFLKHTIVFVSLIVGSFFILIFLISLIIVILFFKHLFFDFKSYIIVFKISRIKKSQKKKTFNSESTESTQVNMFFSNFLIQYKLQVLILRRLIRQICQAILWLIMKIQARTIIEKSSIIINW